MSHGGFLREVTQGASDWIIAVARDWRAAGLDKAERAMLELAEKITKDATRISPADIESLKSACFSHREILDVVLVASYANFITRVADALGVELDETYSPSDPMVSALSYPR